MFNKNAALSSVLKNLMCDMQPLLPFLLFTCAEVLVPLFSMLRKSRPISAMLRSHMSNFPGWMPDADSVCRGWRS